MATKKTTTNSDFAAFNVKVSEKLLAQTIYVYQSNSHQDTSKIKTRGEIRASKRKIYKQKGTGRARHGALSAPIFVGGGIAHGPTGIRPNRKKLTLKMRNKALVGSLSLLQKKQALGLFTPPSVIPAKARSLDPREETHTIKTKQVAAISNTTLVQHQSPPALLKAFSNLQSVKIIPANQLNAYHVFQSKKLLFTPKALEFIKTKLKAYL